KLYINSVLRRTETGVNGTLTIVGTDIRIGDWASGIRSWNGTIDDLMIFNKSLSQDQIRAIYDNKTNIWTTSEILKGDNWSACVTIVDNNTVVGKDTECSGGLIVLNSPPGQGTPTINSSLGTNLTTENITAFNVSTTDNDSDSIKNIFDWRLNGTSITFLNMPFEKNATGTNTKDYSMFGNDGIEGIGSKGVLFNATGGYDGKSAYEFNASNVVRILNNQAITIKKLITISVWVKENNNVATTSNILHKTNVDGGYSVYTWSNRERMAVYDSVGTICSAVAPSNMGTNVWAHIVGTYNGTHTLLYRNGLEIDTTDCAGLVIDSSANNLGIGASQSGSAGFNGTIDDVIIFNRSLSAEQVKALYENKSNIIAASETTKNDNWSACITPNDGDEDGTMVCTENLTVLNTPPEQGTPTINSTLRTNLTTENITVFNISTSDNDSDTVKNIFDWRLNGSSIAVLNMPFEANATGTNTKDYSTFGNDGTEQLGVTFNATGGYDGKGAYEFDGAGDYIDLGTGSGTLNITSDITFMAWIKMNSYTNYRRVLGWENESGNSAWVILLANDAARVGVAMHQADGTTLANYGGDISDKKFHHVAGTYNGSTLNAYVDGSSAGSSTGTNQDLLEPTELNIRIGKTYTNGFDGTIDDVMIFNHSLSADQILAIYNNRTDLISSDETTKNDDWSACITPNDGEEDGTEVCTENLTILNTPPGQGTPTINSSLGTNLTTDNITVFNISTSDNDSDTVKNIFNWLLNGTSITVLNMPFEKVNDSTLNATKDYSMFSNDGTEHSGVTWNATGGYDGKGAFEFDGVDDFITIPDDNSLDLTNQLTISVWVKPESFTVDGGLVNLRIFQKTDSYWLYVNTAGTLAFATAGLSDNTITANWALSGSLQEWTHVAVTFSNETGEKIFYINGSSYSSEPGITGALDITANNLTIGDFDGIKFWNGTIDDFMIFNRSLTPEQVLNLYNNRTDLIDANETYKNDNWSACITPNDGDEDGTMICSENVTILNTPPETTQVSINTTSFNNYTTDDLTCYATFADNDSDQIYANISWYKNSVLNRTNQTGPFPVGSKINIANLSSVNTTKGENWSCQVNAYDGTENETRWLESSLNVTIQITTPEVNPVTPANYTWTTDTTPDLQFNISDQIETSASCEVFVDGVTVAENTTTLNNTLTTLTSTTLAVGTHTWGVNCTSEGGYNMSKVNNTFEIVTNNINISTPVNNSWTNEVKADNVSFTFNFVSGIADQASCELFITNASGTEIANGVNNTTLNNTATILRNNNSLLSTLNPNGVMANWTINCTFNGTTITAADYYSLNVDNTTPLTPTLSLTSSTSSTLTIAVTTSADVTSCTTTTGEISGSGASWTISHGGLQSSTGYTFQVTCLDAADNSVSSSNTFSTAAVGPGSGSGGSSGGTSSSTPGQYEKTVWASINAGEIATVAVDNGVIGVTEISFKAKKTTYGAWVEVQRLDAIPEAETSFENKAYKNLKILANNVEDFMEDTATINFKVEKKWLLDNKINQGNMALFRLVNDKWTPLPTTLGADDGTYIHYTAETPGFSYFVIGAKTDEVVSAGEVVEKAEAKKTIVSDEIKESFLWKLPSKIKSVFSKITIVIKTIFSKIASPIKTVFQKTISLFKNYWMYLIAGLLSIAAGMLIALIISIPLNYLKKRKRKKPVAPRFRKG
ncbi:LamG-like jellyroll fold domain-containing protein, partial [Nanoarchaeota archaeon]